MAKANISTKLAVQEIKRLVGELNTLKASVEKTNKANAASFSKLEATIKNLRKTEVDLNNEIVKLNKALKEKTSNANKAASANNNLSKSQKNLNRDTRKTRMGFSDLVKETKNLFVAFGLIGGARLFAAKIKETFKMIVTFDSLRFSLQKITESIWEYNQSQEFMSRLVTDFGVELVSTTERWTKFLAAAKQSGLSLKDTENIFRSLTKAGAVLGLQTDELRSIYLALEQMLSKGKITTEELRRQLGERLPGAIGIMAASMGVSLDKLDEMMKKGEVISAEVLPNFAEAVEYAFGIENENRIDNLNAALGRLSGAWQTFVYNMSEGQGIISKVFRRILKEVTDTVNAWKYILSDADQKYSIDKMLLTPGYEKTIETQAKHLLKQRGDTLDKLEDLKKEHDKIMVDLTKTTDKEELIRLQKRQDEIMSEIIMHGQKEKEVQREVAAQGFLELQDRLEKEKKLLEEYSEAKLKIEEEQIANRPAGGGVISTTTEWVAGKVSPDTGLAGAEKTLALQRDKVLALEAEYDVRRKILQVSDPVTPESSDDGSGSNYRYKKNLEEIRDLEKEVQLAIVRGLMAKNEEVLAEETTGFAKRMALIKDQNSKRIQEADLIRDIEIDKIRHAERKKLELLEREPTKNQIPFTEKELADQRLAIEKETNQKIEIAKEKHLAKLTSISEKNTSELLSLDKDLGDAQVEITADSYNLRIIEAKRLYNESEQTSKDRERLEEELRDVAIESANAQIDAQIKLLKAKMEIAGMDQEVLDALQRQINALEALKEVAPGEEDSDKWLAYWTEVLNVTSDFIDAFGDIIDNIYEHRIENINAEIEAEKNKYDELLLLAKDDAKQKETLQRNKDKAIEQLEKKRLKEEQKQAKARKAMAVADIAINTAVAIMRAYSDTGPIGGTVFAAIIAALGAVQIAAVLSQPIPKYKEGGNIKKDEVAMINDGIYKEYVERNGEILTTDRKNAIVDLKKGDIVHKNFESLRNNSKVIKSAGGGEYISERDFNRLFNGVTESISTGFKKAKINNKNIIVVEQKDSYDGKISRWN